MPTFIKSHSLEPIKDLKNGHTIYPLNQEKMLYPEGFDRGMMVFTEDKDGKPLFLTIGLCKISAETAQMTYFVDKNADGTVDNVYQATGTDCNAAYTNLGKSKPIEKPPADVVGLYSKVLSMYQQKAK